MQTPKISKKKKKYCSLHTLTRAGHVTPRAPRRPSSRTLTEKPLLLVKSRMRAHEHRRYCPSAATASGIRRRGGHKSIKNVVETELRTRQYPGRGWNASRTPSLPPGRDGRSGPLPPFLLLRHADARQARPFRTLRHKAKLYLSRRDFCFGSRGEAKERCQRGLPRCPFFANASRTAPRSSGPRRDICVRVCI